MATKIERDFTFQSGVYFDSRFMMNVYTATVVMYVETENMVEQNVAMERMKFFVYECLENSTFINDEEQDAIKRFTAADLKVCVLPMEPYEQVIAMMLMTKLNMLAEERLTVVEVSMTSKMSDGVKITYDIDQPLGPFEEDGWWSNKKIVINDLKVARDEDNVVELLAKKPLTWEDIGLTWEQRGGEETKVATIVPLRDS